MADKFELKAIISAVDKMTPTLKAVQRSVKLTSKTINDIGKHGRNLLGSLGIPAGLAFGSVVYGAQRATRAALDYAGAIKDASERTGMSVGAYQELSVMLLNVGGSAEDAGAAAEKFNKGLADAASGTDKGFLALMRKMNIPLRNARGELVRLEEVLPDIAESFARTGDPAMRTRMIMELFGKSGGKLMPILLKGRQGVQDWAAEIRRLGMTVDDDAINKLDDLGDSVGNVGLAIKAQWTRVVADLAPALMPVIKSMGEWIGANKEMLRTEITGTLNALVASLKGYDWRGLVTDMRGAAVAVRDLVRGLGGMKNVLIGIGALFVAGPIASILGIVGALWRFGAGLLALVGGWSAVGSAILAVGKVFAVVGRLFLLNPLGLALTAIAGTAYLVYANWDRIKGWFVDFFNWLPEKIKAIGTWFADLIPDWARELIGGGNVNVNGGGGATPLVQSGAVAMASGRQQLSGDMTVRFENAPPGMRAAPGKTNQPGVSMNPDVGYRSLALLGT